MEQDASKHRNIELVLYDGQSIIEPAPIDRSPGRALVTLHKPSNRICNRVAFAFSLLSHLLDRRAPGTGRDEASISVKPELKAP